MGITKDGIIEIRNSACNLLLTHRINIKTHSKYMKDISKKNFIANPIPRDNKNRLPSNFLKIKNNKKEYSIKLKKKTEKDLEKENGGFGIYNCDMRKFWKLKDNDWNYDTIPEIWNGENISDYIDPDIIKKIESI